MHRRQGGLSVRRPDAQARHVPSVCEAETRAGRQPCSRLAEAEQRELAAQAVDPARAGGAEPRVEREREARPYVHPDGELRGRECAQGVAPRALLRAHRSVPDLDLAVITRASQASRRTIELPTRSGAGCAQLRRRDRSRQRASMGVEQPRATREPHEEARLGLGVRMPWLRALRGASSSGSATGA